MAEFNSNGSDVETTVREAFEKAHKFQVGAELTETLQANWMDTPVGPVLMAGDEERLHLLSFIEQAGMVRKAALIQKKPPCPHRVGGQCLPRRDQEGVGGIFRRQPPAV